MLELPIGAILLAPIGGALLSGTRFRRAVLPCVCAIWLVASFVGIVEWHYLYKREDGPRFEFTSLVTDFIQLNIIGDGSFEIFVRLGRFMASFGFLICAALVGIVESNHITRTKDVVASCVAMFFFALSLLGDTDAMTLVAWLAMDCIAVDCSVSRQPATAQSRIRIPCESLLHASPSLLAVIAYVQADDLLTVQSGFPFDVGLWGLAALLRIALFVRVSSAARDQPSSRTFLRVLCFALPSLYLFSDPRLSSASVNLLCVVVVIGAGLAALANSTRPFQAIGNLQVASVASALLGVSSASPFLLSSIDVLRMESYVAACQLPLLCVMTALLRLRTVLSPTISITLTTLLLVSGVWGQNEATRVLLSVPSEERTVALELTLIGTAIGQFLFCAAITRLTVLHESQLSEHGVGASDPNVFKPTIGTVIGIVAVGMPSIALSMFWFGRNHSNFAEALREGIDNVAGVTILTPVLLLGALAGWYFTKPARSVGDKIAAWCRPISRLARNGWYIQPIVETCVSVPLRVASFLAAKLDARVIGASGENAWKKSVSDVGHSLEAIRRLDVRYSTLCGLLAIVGMLLALWWGA